MKKNRVILFIFIVLVIVIISISAVKTNLERNLERLSTTTINSVNLTNIKDGTYIGEYKAFPVSAKVKVSVEKHRIMSVELIEHNHGQGEAAEIILDLVVDSQGLEVEAIAGATYSSKVILKAIENALTSEIK